LHLFVFARFTHKFLVIQTCRDHAKARSIHHTSTGAFEEGRKNKA
jgi:hypothetical protein